MTAGLVLWSCALMALAINLSIWVIQLKREAQRAWVALRFLDRCAESMK